MINKSMKKLLQPLMIVAILALIGEVPASATSGDRLLTSGVRDADAIAASGYAAKIEVVGQKAGSVPLHLSIVRQTTNGSATFDLSEAGSGVLTVYATPQKTGDTSIVGIEYDIQGSLGQGLSCAISGESLMCQIRFMRNDTGAARTLTITLLKRAPKEKPKPPTTAAAPKPACTFTQVGSGAHFDKEKQDFRFQQLSDRVKLWTYAIADAPRNRGKDEDQSSIRGTFFRTIKVNGPQGDICWGRLIFDVEYVGTIERMTSGVSAVGGANMQYYSRIFSGLLDSEQGYNWSQGVNTLLWKAASDPEHDLAMTVGTTIVGAAAGYGVGAAGGQIVGQAAGQAAGEVAGEVASNVYEVGVQLYQAEKESVKCDVEVGHQKRVVMANTPLKPGHEYKVFISMDAWTKGVAAGLAGGFAEVDFYGLKPDKCDSGSRAYSNSKKGLKVSNVQIIWD